MLIIYRFKYVRISPPAVATRCSEGEKIASFTDPACAISNPRTSDRFTNPCQVTARRNVFQCIHSFIHTYRETILLFTLHCIKFCTILSIAECSFVTELLFELCPLLSFLAAGSLLQWCWESTAGMRKGTLLSGRGRSPVGT